MITKSNSHILRVYVSIYTVVNTLIFQICCRVHIYVTHRGGVSHARPHLSAGHVTCGGIMRDHIPHITHNMLTHQHVTHNAQVMSRHLHSIFAMFQGCYSVAVRRLKMRVSFLPQQIICLHHRCKFTVGIPALISIPYC